MRLASRSLASAVACLAIAALSPRVATAQDTEATATALFDQGRKLMAQHKYAEACPKLAESERLAPSGGTLINLAECYEHTGQTASAWAAWQGAAARANAAGKAAAEKTALARAAALEPALGKLTIALSPGSDVSGVEVKRDGVSVARAEIGSALPVDPGSHTIEVTAPKKKPWTVTVSVGPKESDARVTITLEDDPSAAPASAPAAANAEAPVPAAAPVQDASATPSHGSAQKTIGIVVGAAGIVGLGIGTAFGLSAKSKNDEALDNCRTHTLCTQKGLSLTDDAKSAATASTIAFIVGGAAVATGVVLWLTAPHGTSSTGLRAIPVVAQSYGGVAVDGAF